MNQGTILVVIFKLLVSWALQKKYCTRWNKANGVHYFTDTWAIFCSGVDAILLSVEFESFPMEISLYCQIWLAVGHYGLHVTAG